MENGFFLIILLILIFLSLLLVLGAENGGHNSDKGSSFYHNCHISYSIILLNKCVLCLKSDPEIEMTSSFNFNYYYCMDDGQMHCKNQNTSHHQYLRCPKAGGDDLEKLDIYKSSTHVNGRTLKVVTIEREPFVKVGINFSGVCFELFYGIQEKYNFSSDVFLPYDGNWGSPLPNGTWNGMIGLVSSKEADIGVAGFSLTLERSRVVDFTQSFHQEPTGILIPPPTEGEKLTVLIRPLSAQVWSGVLLTIFILAPSFYFMHIISLRISSGDMKNPLKINCREAIDTIFLLFHFMIGSLVQESVVSPVNKTSRFLIILWWFLTLILSNIYVAYLVSYMSAPQLHNAVNSLEDLVHQKSIKWTFRQNAALQSLFKSKTSSGVYKAIGDGVSEDELVKTDLEGAQRALTGKWAFIKEKSYLDVALGNDFKESGKKCRITLAKQTFFKVETALILQKQSPLLPLINHVISWSVSTGLMEKWKSIHWPKDIWCEDAVSYIPKTVSKTRKLHIEDIQGALFLWGSGLTIAILSFIIERVISLMNFV